MSIPILFYIHSKVENAWKKLYSHANNFKLILQSKKNYDIPWGDYYKCGNISSIGTYLANIIVKTTTDIATINI